MAHTYTYPHDIKDNKYAFRKVTIKVKKPAADENSSAAYNKAKDMLDTAATAAASAATSVAAIQANLASNSKAPEFDTEAVIVLPLPNTFTDQQNHGWSEESGIIGTLGKSATNASVPGLAGKIGGDISIDKVLGATSSSLGLRKPLIDPGYFQNYTGSTPRDFAMTWDFVPSNGAEANDIVMIIMKLKEYSSPKKMVSGVSLFAPYFFSIEFGNPFISAMAKIDRVVIKSLAIDYGADGFMQQHFDGMPKHITLTVSFAEVDMSTADDYNTQRVPNARG